MKKITLLLCLLTMSFANAQLNSVGIVGDGAGGWPGSPENPGPNDIHQMSTTDNVHWTYDNLPVSNGSIKFRGNNSWALPYNWGQGSGNFVAGTASVDGAGITSTPGVYDVTFNSTTGAYTFTVDPNVFPVMGMVGSATPGGWDNDTDMFTTDGINYFYVGVPLVQGALKFRMNHTWTPTTNWGGATFPTGTGTVDGAAIDIPVAGTYNVKFNKNTLAYNIYFPTVALVGGATPGGWPLNVPNEVDPHQMATTDGVNYSIANIALTVGGAKFRAENSWAREWGSNSFPTGTVTQGGGDLSVSPAGNYSVSLNITTGAFSFANLSVGEFDLSLLKAYPNPSKSQWNFDSATESITKIEIVDISGKVVITKAPNNNTAAVDASALSTGVYFARITTAKGSGVLKVVKE